MNASNGSVGSVLLPLRLLFRLSLSCGVNNNNNNNNSGVCTPYSHRIWVYGSVMDSSFFIVSFDDVSHTDCSSQMLQLSPIRCSCIVILWVSLVSFAAITLSVTSQRVIPKVSVYFVIDSVRKLLDTRSYMQVSGGPRWMASFTFRPFFTIGKTPRPPSPLTNWIAKCEWRLFELPSYWRQDTAEVSDAAPVAWGSRVNAECRN
jgi:hypothetical protein